MKPILITIIFVVFFCDRLNAQSKTDCSNASTTIEINDCAQKEFLAADKELNNIYKKVMEKLSVVQRPVLIRAQKKWISFRDDYSKIYESIYAGGTIAASAEIDCKTASTRARIAELKSLFEQLGR
jgi:uncharacterized protein YecT (DUF1311 family)